MMKGIVPCLRLGSLTVPTVYFRDLSRNSLHSLYTPQMPTAVVVTLVAGISFHSLNRMPEEVLKPCRVVELLGLRGW